MSIPGSASPLFFGADAAAADTGYKIDRSLRFNSGDSANLSRTFSSSGNRRTWTLSWWMKLGKLGVNRGLFGMPGTSSSSPQFYSRIGSDDKLYVYEYNTSSTYQFIKKTSAVLRDPSAWYHCVFQFDSTQATAEDGFKIYLNGTRITDWDTNTLTNYATGYEGAWSSSANTGVHVIGRSDAYFDGYMAEIHFVDGQALTADDFGELDDNGVWQPKEFTGTHNTAGGPDYSSQTITNENSGYTTDKMFDGVFGSSASLNNSVIANQTDGTYSVYTFASPISYSSSVRIFGDLDTRSTDPDIKANNTSVTGFTDNINTGGANKKWYTVLSGSGTLSTVSLNQHNGYVAAIFAIEVDGTVLVDNVAAGVNGFYLDFADNSSAAALGNDGSGNDNDFTVNNFSVASGAGNDSLIDTPTNYEASSGENGGNYCTWNPLDMETGVITLSEGNLKTITNSSTGDNVRGTFGFSSGKWYWECTITNFSGGFDIGFATPDWDLTAGDVGNVANSWSVSDGGTSKAEGATSGSATDAFNSVGKVIGIAFDADAGSVKYFIDGTDQGVIFSGLDTSYTYMPAIYLRVDATGGIWNFGQRGSFTYDPPSGYKGLCTQNLDESSYASIPDGSQQFQIKLWNGTGSSGGSNQTITGYNFEPQFVWIKNRDDEEHHALFDQIRGQQKVLYSSLSSAEASQANGLVNFTSDGFQIGIDGKVNALNKAHVGWVWNSATSTSSNSDGSITSNIRANQAAGFSIVSYTGNGAASATIGHGLNAAPEMIMLKNREDSDEGVVYHVGTDTTVPEEYYLRLFSTNNGNVARDAGGARWNDTAPTNSVFSVGTENEVNTGEDYIAYCFTSIPGYSAFGSYTGNGLSDGPFVYTGFRVAWLMIKNVSSNQTWTIHDSTRDVNNVAEHRLLPSSKDDETTATAAQYKDLLSNGFKIRGTSGEQNTDNDVYIYAAFAEHPFRTARAR